MRLSKEMYVRLRTIDGKQSVFTVSKLTTVKQFKLMVQRELGINIDQQRLFFRGKQVGLIIILFSVLIVHSLFLFKLLLQLENEYNIFDYDINLNDVIQLMIKHDDVGSGDFEKENGKNNPRHENKSLSNELNKIVKVKCLTSLC